MKVAVLGGGVIETKRGSSTRSMPRTSLRSGFCPSSSGALSVVVMLEPLDHDHLVRILAEPKSSLVEQDVDSSE